MINMSSSLKEILGENPSLENLVKTKKALLEVMGEKVRELETRVDSFREFADDLFVIDTLIREKENNNA